ncbi:hypothetical protein Bpfe_003100 [Biomphalaria pfeifferi]|uniref:Uncharacterized protein n=1 Tax=Biomphalaria pfeifferi TaxID=112525 RepID=A0AAD8FKS8_BIOPF|nr:hypothetical protein Bpfe_003100 [Biomphalaria pfeifferi]
MMGNMCTNIMLSKVDESVLQVEGQIDQSDKIVSQAKEEINSLVKGQLPGQDCGCTNSGDGGAGDWNAVCDCVVVKSGGDDFHGEKRDNDCCDDEAEKAYVLETMATSGSTTVSRDVHRKGPLTQRLRTTTLESTVIATTSICVKWLATLISTYFPFVSWLASATIFMRSKQRPRYRLKHRLANWKKRK